MALIEHLRKQVAVAVTDNEFRLASTGLGGLTLEVNEGDRSVVIAVIEAEQRPAVALCASAQVWRNITAPTPPVGYHSFTAVCRQQSDFNIDGSPLLVAQSLHALERLFEILRGQVADEAPAPVPDLQQIKGYYAKVTLPSGGSTQLYYERSGSLEAPPLVMLHTAGADARQFHPLLADPGLQQKWSMIAFDMPSHGRSMPMAEALWQDYRLVKQDYIDLCRCFIQQVIGKPAVLLGCSMGAAMALKMATAHPADVAGVIALEAPFRATGRRSPMLAHPQVNQAAHNPSYVRGLMSPLSTLSERRTAAWIYSQGGFQVYAGDLAFYSDEFDAELDLHGLDGTAKGIVLLTGSYDYSASPADSQKVANLIPGARFTIMPDLGHFPMIENPRCLLEYLEPALDYVQSKLEKNDVKSS